MKKIAVALIHVYRYLLSPWVGNQCRFYPTCSYYAEDAIKQLGFVKGSYLAIRRLSKCHPWNPGGIDLVPLPTKKSPPHYSPQHCVSHYFEPLGKPSNLDKPKTFSEPKTLSEPKTFTEPKTFSESITLNKLETFNTPRSFIYNPHIKK